MGHIPACFYAYFQVGPAVHLRCCLANQELNITIMKSRVVFKRRTLHCERKLLDEVVNQSDKLAEPKPQTV